MIGENLTPIEAFRSPPSFDIPKFSAKFFLVNCPYSCNAKSALA